MSTEPVGRGYIPIPDPTVLTAAAVEEAKDNLRRDIEALRLLLEARIAEEHAAMLGHYQIDEEKFRTIQLQLHERDLRFDRAEQAGKEAVSAAFLASRELSHQLEESNKLATAKSEASFTKQIDQLYVLVDARDKAQSARVEEIKERIDRGEGQSAGKQAEVTERRLSMGQAIAIFTAVLFAVSIIVSVAIAVYHK